MEPMLSVPTGEGWVGATPTGVGDAMNAQPVAGGGAEAREKRAAQADRSPPKTVRGRPKSPSCADPPPETGGRSGGGRQAQREPGGGQEGGARTRDSP